MLFIGKKCIQPETGAIREAFFFTPACQNYHVYMAHKGDFQIEDYIFEVGGAGKQTGQIRDAGERGYLFVDSIEVGASRKIPLYLAGLLY